MTLFLWKLEGEPDTEAGSNRVWRCGSVLERVSLIQDRAMLFRQSRHDSCLQSCNDEAHVGHNLLFATLMLPKETDILVKDITGLLFHAHTQKRRPRPKPFKYFHYRGRIPNIILRWKSFLFLLAPLEYQPSLKFCARPIGRLPTGI